MGGPLAKTRPVLNGCLLLAVLIPGPSDASTPPPRSLSAARRRGPVRVDGRLDEAAWKAAAIATDFTQSSPQDSAPPSQRTEVRVLFDRHSLYLGFDCHDRQAADIIARLIRRDRAFTGDAVWVELDSRLDGRSGFYFAVNAAGVQRDGILRDDTIRESAWNGVWESAVHRHERGWSAELRIPFRLLRYNPGPQQNFGLQLARQIGRSTELDQWQHIPASLGRAVSAFGRLTGLDLPPPPLDLEVQPFVVARLPWGDGELRTELLQLVQTGVDLRAGLGSNLKLTATIAPDFGQVEQDEAVLNLSTFETYYREKRPFFLTDSDRLRRPSMPDAGTNQLFYSRRIGQRPAALEIEADETLLRAPQATRILGAAKLTGGTDSGLSLAGMQALTAEEWALAQSPSGRLRNALAAPAASYSVLRVQQKLWGESQVGLSATSFATLDRGSSVSAAADTELASARFKLHAQAEISALSDERLAFQDPFSQYALREYGPVGFGGRLMLERRGSRWLGGALGVSYRSPSLALNDVGFLDRGDEFFVFGWTQLHSFERLGPLHRVSVNINGWLLRNGAGLNIGDGVNINGYALTDGNWRLSGYLGVQPPSCDDRELREPGGPALCQDRSTFEGSLYLTSDDSASLSGSLGASAASRQRGLRTRLSASARLRPTSFIVVALDPSWARSRGQVAYLQRLEQGSSTTYLLGQRDVDTFDLSLRGDLTFSPRLSLQIYSQLFFAQVRYPFLFHPAAPTRGRVVLRGLRVATRNSPDSNFSSTSLNTSVVLRWEYRLGATLFVVYSSSLSDNVDDAPAIISNRVQDMWATAGEQVFLLKLSYLLP